MGEGKKGLPMTMIAMGTDMKTSSRMVQPTVSVCMRVSVCV